MVRQYLASLEADRDADWVLDPFAGTATTPVEARLRGFSTVTVDANPMSVLAAHVKLAWDVDLEEVSSQLTAVLELATACVNKAGLRPVPDGDYQSSLFGTQTRAKQPADGCGAEFDFDPSQILPPETAALIPRGFISTNPLLRVLALRYAVEHVTCHDDVRNYLLLALANTIVTTAGNVGFGPEVYRLPAKDDVDVLGAFADTVGRMVSDLRTVTRKRQGPLPSALVFKDDARSLSLLRGVPPIGIVITSPPYPNEKDYTRSTRLESVLLGFIKTKRGLREVKSGLLRSNTRNVFAGDDDDKLIEDVPSVLRVAEAIEQERQRLGKTSGFERLYHRVTRLYFGGMYRHLAALLPRLRPGARCAYVLGDQMSYFRVHIRTAQLLADVAIKAGYEVEGIELWRTRRSTATGLDLEENVLILRRPESGGGNCG
ncbi:MAG: hypothetical protein KAX19_01850 [Candidatus Brocadiae bacterium]|nr:hypothetical protein [Candidatus Brocadiia bacterium]